MVPKQPTNQPTDRQTGGTQPTDEQTSAGFGKQQKTQEKVSFQAFTMRKQSCSLPCHCKAVRNTLANTQVSQTSQTRPHARNNWGTWRGHNNQLKWLKQFCLQAKFNVGTTITLSQDGMLILWSFGFFKSLRIPNPATKQGSLRQCEKFFHVQSLQKAKLAVALLTALKHPAQHLRRRIEAGSQTNLDEAGATAKSWSLSVRVTLTLELQLPKQSFRRAFFPE